MTTGKRRRGGAWVGFLAGALLAAAGAARAQSSNTDTEDIPLLPAAEVMARVRAAFPQRPLHIEGQLLCRDRQGDLQRTLNAEMLLEWGARPPQARFSVRDAFGGALGQLVIRRPAGATPVYELLLGDPPQAVASPDLQAAVAGSDFTWADLSLSFLWWPGGETAQAEMKKTRLCYVVDLPAPVGAAYKRVRLWVDSHVFALLEADAFGADDKLVKRLEVKSLQKVNDVWTLKDFEVKSYPAKTSTVLTLSRSELMAEAPPAVPAEEAPPSAATPAAVPEPSLNPAPPPAVPEPIRTPAAAPAPEPATNAAPAVAPEPATNAAPAVAPEPAPPPAPAPPAAASPA